MSLWGYGTINNHLFYSRDMYGAVVMHSLSRFVGFAVITLVHVKVTNPLLIRESSFLKVTKWLCILMQCTPEWRTRKVATMTAVGRLKLKRIAEDFSFALPSVRRFLASFHFNVKVLIYCFFVVIIFISSIDSKYNKSYGWSNVIH